jgi:hypothetical protein
MSMNCRLLSLSPAQVAALRSTPSLTQELVVVSEYELIGALYRRMQKSPPSDPRRDAMLAEAKAKLASLGAVEPPLGLEKSWHMLHYLFTGHTTPANAPGDALMSGEPVGDDVGYGPARLIDEAATVAFARFLDTQDVRRLQQRVSYSEMTRLQIYAMPMGGGTEAEFERELRDEVGHYFPALQAYVAKTSSRGHAMLTWIS